MCLEILHWYPLVRRFILSSQEMKHNSNSTRVRVVVWFYMKYILDPGVLSPGLRQTGRKPRYSRLHVYWVPVERNTKLLSDMLSFLFAQLSQNQESTPVNAAENFSYPCRIFLLIRVKGFIYLISFAVNTGQEQESKTASNKFLQFRNCFAGRCMPCIHQQN